MGSRSADAASTASSVTPLGELAPHYVASPTLAWSNGFNGIYPVPPPSVHRSVTNPPIATSIKPMHDVASTRFFSPQSLLSQGRAADRRGMNSSVPAHPFDAEDSEGPPIPMPVPQIDGFEVEDLQRDTSTDPLATRSYHTKARAVPPSTLYPSTLPSNDLNEGDALPDVNDAASSVTNEAEGKLSQDIGYAVRAIKEGLGWLPAEILAGYGKEELRELIVKAIESSDAAKVPVAGSTSGQSDEANSSSSIPKEYPGQVDQLGRADYAANDWFEMMAGSPMPLNWKAEYDYSQGAWYFVNYNTDLPTTTWDDPRLQPPGVSPEIAMPVAPPSDTYGVQTLPPQEAYARWYADAFARYEAYRQLQQGRKGPVEAELKNERKRASRLHRAKALLDEANRRLLDATTAPPSKDKARERESAEIDLARAQGMLDRIKAEDDARRAVLPDWLAHYQGPVHGFDWSRDRQRTHYVDARPAKPPSERDNWPHPSSMPPRAVPLPAAGMQDRSFDGPTPTLTFDTGSSLPAQLPPQPHFPPLSSLRAKSSTVPTPYGIPEAYFAWDMLLRASAPTTKLAGKPAATQPFRRATGSMTVHTLPHSEQYISPYL